MMEAGKTTERDAHQAAEEELESQGLVDVSPLRLERRDEESGRHGVGWGLLQGPRP